ncbi:hypothetical protein BGX21_010377 [Mortierella sp. AD011]|nr:hypothetical protein BGX20_007999 [Mortierella sp. AD010]KAF9394394.1 hypothetical protein BGX21_010377 [Mortierella sp. AD011]
MSSLGDGSAAELAQKYKDKALARKRGAGTHQPKFRGFTLAKPSDNVKSATADNDNNTLITEIAAMTTTKTTTVTESIRVLEAVEIPVTFSDNPPNPPATSNSASGLNEKYQERFKARFRGAGAHQPDFRGFSLKPSSSKNSERQSLEVASATSIGIDPIEAHEPPSRRSTTISKQSEKSNRDKAAPDTRESHINKRAELTKALKALSITKAGSNIANSGESTSSSTRRRTKPISTLRKEHADSNGSKALASSNSSSRYTDSTQPIDISARTPSAKQTRSTSRSSGYSPGFSIAWGRNSTTLISKPNQPSETKSGRPAQPISEQRPVIEDTIDDIGVIDDFDPLSFDHIPSPTHDDFDQEPDPNPPKSVATHDTSRSKRKPISSSIPDTVAPTLAHKSGHIPAKRRRLIQEEVDENEDPLPIHQNQVNGVSKTSDGQKKPVSDNQQNKDKRLDTVANPEKQKKSKPTEKSQVAAKPKAASKQDTTRSLRQTTLMQLASKPIRKDEESSKTLSSTTRNQQLTDDSGSESDFVINTTKTRKSSKMDKSKSSKKAGTVKKGASEQTLKNYKQLQIHCLKFWGPFGAASRPATVSNRATAKQSSVQGEASAPSQKTVQSVLEIEDTPLTEMDVIADAVRDVVDKFIDSLEDQSIAKEMLMLRSDLETVLIEQVDILDDHTLLRASARKAAALKKELRVRLLETQRQRQKTREELKKVRANFEREERARRRLEETHKFLTDLEALRDHVVGSDEEGEEEDEAEEGDNLKTGLQSLIATVGSRCGGGIGGITENKTETGMLGTLEEFNKLLETMEKNLQSMPLVTHSQEVSSRRKVFGDDDDIDDNLDVDFFNV